MLWSAWQHCSTCKNRGTTPLMAKAHAAGSCSLALASFTTSAHKRISQVTFPCIISTLHGQTHHIALLSQDLGCSLCKSAWTDLCKIKTCLFQHPSLFANPVFGSDSVRRGHNMIKFGQNLPWRFKEVCQKRKQGRDVLSPSLKAATAKL